MPADFALLAPVPLVHLESAQRVAERVPYVAFGSMKWEFFQEVDAARRSQPVHALLYPSHDEDRAEFSYKVGWLGWYIGSSSDQSEKHADEKAGRRPPTAIGDERDTPSFWAVFWRVARLTRIPPQKWVEIRALNNYRTGDGRENAPPRGPERIRIPFGFEFPPRPEPNRY